MGTSAAVVAWAEGGRQVDYLLVTRGEAGIEGLAPAEAGPVREEEQRRTAAAVGAASVTFLGYRDGQVEEGVALRRDLARAIRRSRPEVLVTLNHGERWGPAPGAAWNTADRRATGRSAIDAVGDAANEWTFPELTDEGLAIRGGVGLIRDRRLGHAHARRGRDRPRRRRRRLPGRPRPLPRGPARGAPGGLRPAPGRVLHGRGGPRFGGHPGVAFEDIGA